MGNDVLISEIVLQYMQDGIVLIGNQGKIIHISRNAKKILNIKVNIIIQGIQMMSMVFVQM